MIKSLFVLFTIIILVSINLLAQNPYIQHYTANDGLPSNMVYQVYQDSKKFIWFATDAGVAKFDGSKFIYYRKQDGLSCNDVVRIKEDSYGRIWFFNLNATLNFYYKNNIYNAKNAPFLDSLKSNEFFRDFYEDNEKNLHFYYNHQREIFTLNTKDQVKKHILPSKIHKVGKDNELIEGMVIRHLSQDSGNTYCIWTIAGIFYLKSLSAKPNLLSNLFNYKAVFPATPNSHYAVICVKNYPTDKLELLKFRGIEQVDKEMKRVQLSTLFINSVLEDTDGSLWVATFDKGVFCYKGNKIIRHFDIKEAQAIIQDHESNIWVTSLKDGVFKISPNINQHIHYENGNFDGKGILTLATHRNNGIWFSNGEKIYLLQNVKLYTSEYNNSKYSFNQILHLRNNNLLVGEKNNNQFILENIQLNEIKKTIRFGKSSISPKPFKKIVTNLNNDKLNCFDSFQLYIIDPEKLFRSVKYKLLDERIYNIYYNYNNELIINAKRNYIYKNDSLWVYKELSCFDNKIITNHLSINKSTELINIEGDSLFLLNNKKLYNLTSAFGYPIDLQIRYMDYHESTLFIATTRNVYVCENPLNIIQNKLVNLIPIDFSFRNIHSILYCDGLLYIGSDDGLTAIPFAEIHKVSAQSPLPYFQSIRINDKDEIVNLQNISLSGRNRLHFIFNAINYTSSPVVFSYTLVGSDNNWTTGSGTDVVYQNLPRGEYVFRLKARKPTSPWSKPIEYRITIKATLWQHPLFYAFVAVCIAGLVFLFALRRKNLQLKRREMDHQIVILEQKALQSMMNPHFIFNALGSIQNFLLQNKPGEAGLYLSQFARLIRQNLSAINSAMINLDEETDRLKNYMDLERLRMENKFDYSIVFENGIEEEEVVIPSMIIQPFIENAIWHGISAIDYKGFIRISFAMLSPDTLKITIEDNGIGIKQAGAYSYRSENHLHMGMAMTRKRLEIIGKRMKIHTSVDISDLTPSSIYPGTIVVIVVPVSYGKPKA